MYILTGVVYLFDGDFPQTDNVLRAAYFFSWATSGLFLFEFFQFVEEVFRTAEANEPCYYGFVGIED